MNFYLCIISLLINNVLDQFIEHGTPAQREELVKNLAGQMVSLSLQMYRCRVIQKVNK